MQSYDLYAELKNTNNILMELPCFRQLSDDNELLHERIQSLKATIEYLESKNRRLSSKIVKYKTFYKKSKKIPRKNQLLSNVIDLVSDDDDSDDNVPAVVVDIKQEKVIVQEAKGDQDQEEVVQDQEEVVQDKEEVVQEEVVQEEVIEYEIVEVVEGDQEETEEEEEEEEEAKGDQEVVEEEEEEEVVEEEEEEVVEEEEEGKEAEEEEDAEVYDIEINGKTYYVQNEKDSPIYEADENGDISMEVGLYKKGIPTFF